MSRKIGAVHVFHSKEFAKLQHYKPDPSPVHLQTPLAASAICAIIPNPWLFKSERLHDGLVIIIGSDNAIPCPDKKETILELDE